MSTYMTRACKYGSNDVIRYLITHGADVNAVDYEGKSPLEVAVMSHLPVHTHFTGTYAGVALRYCDYIT